MKLFDLSTAWLLLLCFTFWPFFQLASAWIALRMPDHLLSYTAFMYRTRTWEKGGRIYDRLFFVRRWKRYLPDGGSIVKGGFRKKTLTDISAHGLERFLLESCRAELTHWLAIVPFWFFGFFAPPQILLYMLIYALAVNMPCIIAQRYNRPRILGLLKIVQNRRSI